MDDDKIKSEASAESNGGSKHFKSEDEALKAGYCFVFKDEAGDFIGFTDEDEAYDYQLEQAKKESVSYHSITRAQAADINSFSEALKSANEAAAEMKRLLGETPETMELFAETFTPIRKAADRFLAIFKEHEGKSPDKPYYIRNIIHLVSVILYQSENRPTIGIGDLMSYYDGKHPTDRQRFMEYDLRYIQGEINRVYNMSLHEMAVAFGKGVIGAEAEEHHATFSDRCDQLDLLMSQVWELYRGRYGYSPKGEFQKWAKDIHYPVDLFGFNPNKKEKVTPIPGRDLLFIHEDYQDNVNRRIIIEALRKHLFADTSAKEKCMAIWGFIELGYIIKPKFTDFAATFPTAINPKGKRAGRYNTVVNDNTYSNNVTRKDKCPYNESDGYDETKYVLDLER